MAIIINFLKENYQFVIYVSVILVELILIICKKSTKIDSVKEQILKFLPFAINLTEQFLNLDSSSIKLSFCIDTVKEHFGIKTSDYDEFIKNSIESILTTPKKKVGRSTDEK